MSLHMTSPAAREASDPLALRDDFVVKALAEKLSGAEVFRVFVTAFLDAHTFDTRRVMKCCLAHLLPSGHMVPFCAYNTLYRDGHVPLPPLAEEAAIKPKARRESLAIPNDVKRENERSPLPLY